MASNSPGSFSRFKDTDLIKSVNGVDTYGLFKKYSFLDQDNVSVDSTIKIVIDSTLAGRPDLISTKLYSTPIYDWIVIMFNRVQNPFEWPKIGDVIKAPSKSIVMGIL